MSNTVGNSCVHRLIEQWDALMLYFEPVVNTDNLLVLQRILSQMQNPIWILYLHFLDFVLLKFTNLNLMFQSSKMSLSVSRIEYCISRISELLYDQIKPSIGG